MRAVIAGGVLQVAVLVTPAGWANAAPQVPTQEPVGATYGVSSFHHEPGYDSFQIRHPALTALGHLAALGCWPARYGDDLRTVSIYEDGWTREQADLLRPLAVRAYQGWVRVWGVLIAAIVVSAFARRVRASIRHTSHTSHTRHTKQEGI